MDFEVQGPAVTAPIIDLTFAHCWQVEILAARPFILPRRHFVYPIEVQEIEQGALEFMVRPEASAWQPFLATCALGFRDPAVPTGIWSTPNPEVICAVSGGYAYLIDVSGPQRFTMIPYRPVIEVRPLLADALLLFVGHHAILAWGANGQEWESSRLSSEGVTVTGVESGVLHGRGWDMLTDKETPFVLDLRTGKQISSFSR